jgi:hypothetical protein
LERFGIIVNHKARKKELLEETMNFQNIWNFLNQNIISEAVGAFIFGLIATYSFYKYSKIHETKELISRVSFYLKQEVEENEKNAEFLKKILNETRKVEKVMLIPAFKPFRISILSAIFYGEFLKVLPIQKASLIIELFYKCEKANEIYKQLDHILRKEFEKLNEPGVYWSDLTIQRRHYVDTLEKYLLPSIIQSCNELLKML